MRVDLRAWLEGEGFRPRAVDAVTLRATFRVGRARFPLLVRTAPDGFVVFAIVPIARAPRDDFAQAALLRRLLEHNHLMMHAKFSVDDDLDVWLSVEHPAATLDEAECRDALNALAFYAERHHEELRALAAARA